MKKLILIIVIIALPLRYASAQCQNSPEFLKNLEICNKFYNGDSTYATWGDLEIDLAYVKSCIKTLESVKNEADYVTVLDQVGNFYMLHEDIKKDFYFNQMDMDSSLWTFKHHNYKLSKELNSAYNLYYKNLSENKFTKSALDFINKEIKTISFITSEKFDIVPKVSLQKKFNEYTNYEIYILIHFYTMEEIGDLSSLLEDKEALKLAADKLIKSDCPLYSKIGKELQGELEQ